MLAAYHFHSMILFPPKEKPTNRTTPLSFKLGSSRHRFVARNVDMNNQLSAQVRGLIGCDFCSKKFTKRGADYTYVTPHTTSKPFSRLTCLIADAIATHIFAHTVVITAIKALLSKPI